LFSLYILGLTIINYELVILNYELSIMNYQLYCAYLSKRVQK